jgi:hypothetical protein
VHSGNPTIKQWFTLSHLNCQSKNFAELRRLLDAKVPDFVRLACPRAAATLQKNPFAIRWRGAIESAALIYVTTS